MNTNSLPPVHPGEILRDRLLKPLNINPTELAKELKFSEKELKLVCEGKVNVTSDLARRLSIYFDTSVELWLNLQKSYEEELEERKFKLLKKEIKPYTYKESRGDTGIENRNDVRQILELTASARNKKDFDKFPGLDLELIQGTKNHYSIRINKQ
ncbi:3474_t:CDS:2 [Entrophospora sp. SA101]|nr:366_t:CDS:2 [Entrophospora sp. SA101]CAJ0747235.1 3474_t:CDS:2 [Entrophospora sp. SA101]CAJ0842964.1 13689_t:CDS:2 [Entrophospora sp. SA101]